MSPTKNRAAISSARRKTGKGPCLPFRPTKLELSRAAGKGLKDVIAPRLRVLFVGINPGLYSGATGHHFARPGNRFWPALHAAGFTRRQLHPSEQRELLKSGFGVTNLVNRATATADQLDPTEFLAGRQRLAAKIRKNRPHLVAFLGLGAYRLAFAQPEARIGRQADKFEGSAVWVLPNPSGLNANYQLGVLTGLFRQVLKASR